MQEGSKPRFPVTNHMTGETVNVVVFDDIALAEIQKHTAEYESARTSSLSM